MPGKMLVHQIPKWAADHPDVLTRCHHDVAFRLRIMSTVARDADIMVRAARAWIARTGAKPPPPERAPGYECPRCHLHQTYVELKCRTYAVTRERVCRACKDEGAGMSIRGRPINTDLIEREGFRVGEERVIDGERWRVSHVQVDGEHHTRIALYPVCGPGSRRHKMMAPHAVRELPLAEVSNAAE